MTFVRGSSRSIGIMSWSQLLYRLVLVATMMTALGTWTKILYSWTMHADSDNCAGERSSGDHKRCHGTSTIEGSNMTAFVEQDSRASDAGTIDKASGFETSSPGKRPLLFIAIGTAARYTERRRAIRDSWLRWAVNDGGEELVRHLFYTDVDNAADKETIDEEHRIYNDIVMLPTATGRHGYGYRGVATIQHAHTAMVDAPYLLKMDDDGFLCLPKLLRELRHYRPRERFVMGRAWYRKGSREHPGMGRQRLDESFLLFSRDVVNFIVRGTAGGLLAFDGRATFAVNFAFWTHAMNLTIFDDRARIDSQQHFITDYMHASQVDESLVRNGTYGLFCEQYIYAHHVRSGDIMRAAFETQRGNDDKNTVSDAAATKHGDVSPITPPRQVNYVFKTERFTSRLPNCTCYSLAVFVPPEMHALDYDTAWSNDKDPPI